jgi:hypothetical protein
MQVTIELPDDIAEELRAKNSDIPRAVLEAIALEGYRKEELTHAQVMRLLGFKNRVETDAFLKAAGIYLEYSEADRKGERDALQQLRQDGGK